MAMSPSRPDFCHPYQPYDIQLQFMQQLYQCIENKNIGIFESPTGTGKSLSLICGALTWLRDHARRELEQTAEDVDESDWLAAAEVANRRQGFLRDREDLAKRLQLIRDEDSAKHRAQLNSRSSKRAKIEGSAATPEQHSDDEFVLKDYEDLKPVSNTKENLSSSTQALLDQLKPTVSSHEEEQRSDTTKVIFCSRTHSQLTQFVHELVRVKPPPGLPPSSVDHVVKEVDDPVKHLPLGSRKNLCINPRVNRLNSTTAINERCLDLQKANVSNDKKCQFLPTKETRNVVDAFGNRAIATIRDIEDLASLGREMGVCPYYSSRTAIASAEVLTLPYPLLLQKSAREALGVHVKDNIIVIDEAHNLMDAIADTMSVTLSLASLDLATKQITFYIQRFKNRLKGANRVYITQILRLMNSLSDFLRNTLAQPRPYEIVVTATQLLSGKGVDQIQPQKLLEYLHHSKLVHKVEGYAEANNEKDRENQPRGVLQNVQSFLSVLMNPDSEGRFFVVRQDEDIMVKYTLLDPRQHFRDIVEDARAVILAGGTMSPMSDYANYLFSYLDPDRLKTFSFAHVIPKQNLLAEPITKGPTGVEFDFTYSNRNSETIIVELGEMVLRVCAVVPDGIVAFFPSYDFLSQVTSIWRKKRAGQCIHDKLSTHKQMFEESRQSSVENLLGEFGQAIDSGKGGLMLSVVGGKLSEGINFSDKLGRAVIAVGLPFPNMNSGEWKAKIEHVEQAQIKQSLEAGIPDAQCKLAAKAAGRDFYENVCMRAINQSIGRAIRHRNDFAAILLVDRRFSSERIRKKLPRWILTSMSNMASDKSWATIERDIHEFFAAKQT